MVQDRTYVTTSSCDPSASVNTSTWTGSPCSTAVPASARVTEWSGAGVAQLGGVGDPPGLARSAPADVLRDADNAALAAAANDGRSVNEPSAAD